MAKDDLQDKFHSNMELKKLLGIAERKPIGCAVALTPDKKEAVLLLNRKFKGKKLAKRLKSEVRDEINLQSVRFGYASVLPSDPSTLQLQTNKPLIGGSTLPLLKILRKATYTAINATVNDNLEDEAEDAEFDDAGDEEEGDETPATAAAPGSDRSDAPAAEPTRAPEPERPAEPEAAAAPPPPPPPSPGTPEATAANDDPSDDELRDAAARAKELFKLVGPAALAYPSRKAQLMDLAGEAKALLLERKDPAAKLDALQAALREIAKLRAEGRPAGGAAAAGQDTAKRDEAVKAGLAQAEQFWRNASGILRSRLDDLKTAIVDAYADDSSVQGTIRGRLNDFDAMFDWMDGRLESKIAEALKAGSAEERRGLAREGASVVADYLAAAKSQAKIKDLDENPFGVQTRFGATISEALPKLEKAMLALA